MKLTIDTQGKTLNIEKDGVTRALPLYSPYAFMLISEQWLKIGWELKYSHTFSWMGRPIIQLPEDMIRIQEVIYRIKPDVIIETGVAHGGSLIYYASLCNAIGNGRVIGIDIEIRKPNRKAIESHELFSFISLIEGSSVDPEVVKKVKSLVRPRESVLVVLDSLHTKQHVRAELETYHELITPGSYIIATDGIMKDLSDMSRGKADWTWDNPTAAAAEFARDHPEFLLEQPAWPFNESSLKENITHWPGAWLKRADD